MKLHTVVDTRIVIACEILFPRHEKTITLPSTTTVRETWQYAYTYVRDALRNNADSVRVELYDGCRQVFKLEAKDPYWYGTDRILINHVTLER